MSQTDNVVMLELLRQRRSAANPDGARKLTIQVDASLKSVLLRYQQTKADGRREALGDVASRLIVACERAVASMDEASSSVGNESQK
jgi:hypothetical protein